MSATDLSHIESKFQLLLKRLQLLHDEKQKLAQKILADKAEILRQQEVITELEEKVKMLEMTTSPADGLAPADGAYRKEMRATLNAYIQEIDNCIAQLNK